jgi:hypothetical protein
LQALEPVLTQLMDEIVVHQRAEEDIFEEFNF